MLGLAARTARCSPTRSRSGPTTSNAARTSATSTSATSASAAPQGGAPEPVLFARSTDGGENWSQRQITAATNNNQTGGRQGCAIRTDSRGRCTCSGSAPTSRRAARSSSRRARSTAARSFGGRASSLASSDVGHFDPAHGRFSFDGVAGARTWSIPSVDIANGAPTGDGATDEIVSPARPDRAERPQPGPNERCSSATRRTAANPSRTGPWGRPRPTGRLPGDRHRAYRRAACRLVYDAFHQPWQSTTLRHAARGRCAALGGGRQRSSRRLERPSHRGASGDARGSSANGAHGGVPRRLQLRRRDRGGVTLVWNDVRNGADCPAIDAYRQAYADAVRAGSAEPADEDNPNDYDAPTTAPPAPSPPPVQQACGQPPTASATATSSARPSRRSRISRPRTRRERSVDRSLTWARTDA